MIAAVLGPLAVWPLAGQLPPAGRTSVQSALKDEDGKAVAKALVVLAPLQPKDESGTKQHPGHRLTDADGAFRFDDIDREDYTVCVYTSNPEFLNPCIWPRHRLDLPLARSAGPAPANLVLRRGAAIRIRIEDPEGLLPSTQKPEARGVLLMGVWTKEGIFLPAQKVAESRYGHEYLLTVPFEERLKLYVDGRQLVVLNESGQTIRPGTAGEEFSDRSKRAYSYRFRVTAEIKPAGGK